MAVHPCGPSLPILEVEERRILSSWILALYLQDPGLGFHTSP